MASSICQPHLFGGFGILCLFVVCFDLKPWKAVFEGVPVGIHLFVGQRGRLKICAEDIVVDIGTNDDKLGRSVAVLGMPVFL